MCGIVGMYNHSKHCFNADKILTQALFASQLRGRDSVGVFLERNDGQTDHLKIVGPVDEFTQWKSQHERFYEEADRARIVVGHTRAATIGDKSDINAAHPHVTKNIMLVHNGTLNHYPDKKKHVSDSAAVAAMLEEEPDFIQVEDGISGAWAFVWYDRRDQSLNFARNDSRPLDFISLNSGEVFFASEGKMMEWLLTREGGKNINKTWSQEARVWTKILPDRTIKETKIPFGSRKWANSDIGERVLTLEEFQSLPECKRAFETISGSSKPLKWNQCKFQAGEAPKDRRPSQRPIVLIADNEGNVTYENRDPDMEAVQRHLALVEGFRRSRDAHAGAKPHGIQLTEWAGMKPGDSVFMFPVKAIQNGSSSERIRIEGSFAIFNEDGTMVPVDGVEVRSQLFTKEDNTEVPLQDRLESFQSRMIKGPLLYDCTVRSIMQDRQTRRIIIWCNDAEWSDWFRAVDYAVTTDDVLEAYSKPFDFGAASEVAAIEKKSQPARKTSSSTP